jgi:dGTPase
MSDNGSRILGDLFKVFRDDPSLLPVHVRDRFAEDGEARATADYAAGMTDRFAMAEHERLLGTHGRR